MVFKDVKLFAETSEDVRKQTYAALFRMNTSKYLAAKVIGGGTKLVEPGSDISLEVAKGVSAVIVQHIHTNLESVRCAVPKSECIVSPVVTFRVLRMVWEKWWAGSSKPPSPIAFKTRMIFPL